MLAAESLLYEPDASPASAPDLSPAAGRLAWALGDHLNSVRDLAVWDEGLQQTVIENHRAWNAFGALASETNPADSSGAPPTETSLFGYTGLPFDARTGLQHNRARWLDPATHTFLSPDPIADDPHNSYRYVGNSPTMATDPSGLEEMDSGTGVFARLIYDPIGNQNAVVQAREEQYKRLMALYEDANHKKYDTHWVQDVLADCAADLRPYAKPIKNFKRGYFEEFERDLFPRNTQNVYAGMVFAFGYGLGQGSANFVIGAAEFVANPYEPFHDLSVAATEAVAYGDRHAHGDSSLMLQLALFELTGPNRLADWNDGATIDGIPLSPGELDAQFDSALQRMGTTAMIGGSTGAGVVRSSRFLAKTTRTVFENSSLFRTTQEGGILSEAPSSRSVTQITSRPISGVNADFVEAGYKAPYSGRNVREFVSGQDMQFVRVHGEGNKARSWMMRADEIEGLTPAQIRDKFALPDTPSFVSDVYVPSGTKIRVGKTAAQEAWGSGGAYQYELLQRLPESAFRNTRQLP